MSSTEDFRLAVRLVILDVEELVDEIDTTDVSTRRGVENLFESQLAALRHVDQELGKVRLNQRLRALTQATVGVLPTLLTSVESCLLYTSPSPRDLSTSRMPSSA